MVDTLKSSFFSEDVSSVLVNVEFLEKFLVRDKAGSLVWTLSESLSFFFMGL